MVTTFSQWDKGGGCLRGIGKTWKVRGGWIKRYRHAKLLRDPVQASSAKEWNMAWQSSFPETSLTFPTKQLPLRKARFLLTRNFKIVPAYTWICRGKNSQLFCHDYWGRASMILYTKVKWCFPQGTSRARGRRILISSLGNTQRAFWWVKNIVSQLLFLSLMSSKQ